MIKQWTETSTSVLFLVSYRNKFRTANNRTKSDVKAINEFFSIKKNLIFDIIYLSISTKKLMAVIPGRFASNESVLTNCSEEETAQDARGWEKKKKKNLNRNS